MTKYPKLTGVTRTIEEHQMKMSDFFLQIPIIRAYPNPK
jgi:hypothetical protein